MDNDVFQFSADSTDYSASAVADGGQDTTPPVLADDPAQDVGAGIVMNQEIDDTHAYAVVNGDMIVNGVHLTAVGDYDATVALYGSLVDGDIEGYANLINAVESMNAGHGFGMG